jgi:uncharacterized membrane protein
VGIGVSIFLIAVGAILTFAVEVNSSDGFNINTIGVILMVVGGLGLLASLTILSSWRGRRDDVVIEERRVL